MNAMPQMSESRERLNVIPGTVPPPTAWPSGCRFRDRCPYSWERCETEHPPLYQISEGHTSRCHLAVEPEASRSSASSARRTSRCGTMTEPLLSVKNLRKVFPITKGVFARKVGEVRAVHDVSFEIMPGETLSLVGESGCGKTTTGRAILRLIEPTSGEVKFAGRDVLAMNPAELRAARREMQIIFQDPVSSLNPRMTVGTAIREGMTIHSWPKAPRRTRRVRRLLDEVGLRAEYAASLPARIFGRAATANRNRASPGGGAEVHRLR